MGEALSAEDSFLLPAPPITVSQTPQPGPPTPATTLDRGSGWGDSRDPAGAGTAVTAPFKEIQLGSSAIGAGATSVGTKGVCSQGEGALAHPVSSAWAWCLHCLPALPLWARCLGVVPTSPPALPVVLRWEATAGAGRHPVLPCASQPCSHNGLAQTCSALWHIVLC